jgi:hypothetical protein
MPLFQSTLVDFSYKTGVLTPGGKERSRLKYNNYDNQSISCKM